MRKKIIAGNWKMNKILDQGMSLASEIIQMVKDEVMADVQVVLVPPFIHLTELGKLIEGSDNIFLGAQNCSNKAAGAYTGEVSVAMIKSAGTSHVLIGHSERREYFSETNEILAEKLNLALEEDLTPIFCCGESLEVRKAGNHFDFVANQLTESLFHLTEDEFNKIVLAYEPIWAIGTGETATAEQAQDMHAHLRNHLANKFGEGNANVLSILYGGSCKPSNAAELFAGPDVDGGLIGGASLNSRDFVDIIKSI